MPELPEVETMRRGILPIVGGKIARVFAPKIRYRPLVITPSVKSIDQRLQGQIITAVRRLGKRVLIDTQSELTLVLQPKMSGLVAIGQTPTQDHIRLVIELTDCSIEKITYWDSRGLGTIALMSAVELASYFGPERLGPDALEITIANFYTVFAKLRREIKPALLEQQRVAGIGNLYASEILHLAKVHPRMRCDEISKPRYKKIFEKMRYVLDQAILYEGSTLSDGTYRNSLNKDGQYQNAHRVYDRESLPCLSCRHGKIERIVQSQRSTFFCPKCQR